MESQWNVRPARPADAARIAEIYNESIQEPQATLETQPKAAAQIIELMCTPAHHVYVAEWGGSILGWASICPYSGCEPYHGVGEARIYISRSSRFQGLGRILMEALVRGGEERDYYKLVGRIPAGNEPSRRLCRSLGFREVGIHEKHGRLGDRWVDVVVVEKLIGRAVAP